MQQISMIFLYLDPGTGSLLIQFTIAAISGILIFFKQISLIVKNIYHSIFKNNREDKA